MIEKKKIAIVILAYADYESLEIALAAHSKFLPENVKMFILQNGSGSYDCERTLKVAQRYKRLFPSQIEVIDWIIPQVPYLSIKELLNSDKMKDYDYIVKMDDDTFPITKDWFDKLCKCYEDSEQKYGDQLGYVTSLVNNNPWGFKEVLTGMNLEDEYFSKYAREHIVGSKIALEPDDYKLLPKEEIGTGESGTVWGNAYISRWLHNRVSLNPDEYINTFKDFGYKEVDNTRRYSINCMMFKKDFWNKIGTIGTPDDEKNTACYCRKHDKKIISNLSIPMVHLFFFTQRNENKDLIPVIRNYYEKWLDLPYPISICPLKEYENENRLRWLEQELFSKSKKRNKWYQEIFSVRNVKYGKQFTILGYKYIIKKHG